MVDWLIGILNLRYRSVEKALFCRSYIDNLSTFDLPNNHSAKAKTMGAQVLACSLSTYNNLSKPIVCKFCSRPCEQFLDSKHSSLMVLPANVYASASNSCMNALDGQCHWIPFSTITHKKCEDCPPICRGKHQPLSLAQFVIGLSILIHTSSFELVPILAMISDQFPNNRRLLVMCTTKCGL